MTNSGLSSLRCVLRGQKVPEEVVAVARGQGSRWKRQTKPSARLMLRNEDNNATIGDAWDAIIFHWIFKEQLRARWIWCCLVSAISFSTTSLTVYLFTTKERAWKIIIKKSLDLRTEVTEEHHNDNYTNNNNNNENTYNVNNYNNNNNIVLFCFLTSN